MRVHVDNLSPDVSEQELREIFEEYGQVEHALIAEIGDNRRGEVDMPLDNQAYAAIEALNGKEIKGQKVEVKETVLTRTFI
ncbi:MAG: RNA recognition motif domain-containing protein [Desulfovibrionales bacterium]